MIRTAAVVSLLTVGPAFAGDSVMWGEQSLNGALRVMQAVPGRDPVLVHRLPPDDDRRHEALEASAERFALTVSTARRRSDDSLTINAVATGGPFKGPLGRFGCESVTATDVDGDRIAVAGGCGIAIHAPGGVTAIPADEVRDVALAGRYLAWTGDELVVHDLVTGATALRLSRPLLVEVALQPDGVVVFSSGSERRQHVAWAAPGTPGVARVDTAARFDGLRVADGRVLYERRTGRREGRRVLMLRSLRDGTARRLARFTARRSRVGDLDLTATRAAWGVRPAGRHMRIVVRAL